MEIAKWSPEWKADQLALLKDEWSDCDQCGLCKTRIKTVFGSGNPNADILFVGEGPGENEDETGRPFEGDSGELFNLFWEGIGQKRSDIFMTNLIQCRTPKNRDPTKDEKAACRERLMKTIYIIDPLLVVTLGKPAMQTLLKQRSLSVTKAHGHLFSPGVRVTGRVFPRTGDNKEVWYLDYDVVPLYHPAYILRVDSYNDEDDSFSRGGPAEQTIKDLETIVSLVAKMKETYRRGEEQYRRR